MEDLIALLEHMLTEGMVGEVIYSVKVDDGALFQKRLQSALETAKSIPNFIPILPVSVDGVVYANATVANMATGVSTLIIRMRCASADWPNYFYVWNNLGNSSTLTCSTVP